MSHLRYHLHPLVRARKESFGLLLYNTRDTKLTFVRCGDMLRIRQVAENVYALEVKCQSEEARSKARRALELLVQKGLVVETRVSP